LVETNARGAATRVARIPGLSRAGWPSYRSDKVGESGKINHLIREHWCPLFDEYGVQLAFEHHDHAYKRTYPIRKGTVDPRGVVYLGDGAWGVTVRKRMPKAGGISPGRGRFGISIS
jgi:hypothetical protein